mmetsp:Transcript_40822/g.53787  ORF Transcript_40822/g.53787 Transcript_40822/m.53787 type:complete len:310 (-) Transcript_40822:73-1002(-)
MPPHNIFRRCIRENVSMEQLMLFFTFIFTFLTCQSTFCFQIGPQSWCSRYSEHSFVIAQRTSIIRAADEKNTGADDELKNFSAWYYEGESSKLFDQRSSGLALFNATEASASSQTPKRNFFKKKQASSRSTQPTIPTPRSVTGMFGHTPPPMTDESWKSSVFEFRSIKDPLDLENQNKDFDENTVVDPPDWEWIRQVLTLDASSTWEQTRTAFLDRIRKLHPDTQSTMKLLGDKTAGTEAKLAEYRRLIGEWKSVQYYRKKEHLHKSSRSKYHLWTPKDEEPGSLDFDSKSMFDEDASTGWLSDDVYSE